MAPSLEMVIVRFEAVNHPLDANKPAVMCVCEGLLPFGHPVREVLECPLYEGAWYASKKSYLYPLPQYAPLLDKLQLLAREKPLLPNRLPIELFIEPVPTFVFRCVDEAHQRSQSFRHVKPDESDVVYQQLQAFQKTGVAFILRHGGRGMIADEMGLGKTVQAIAVAHFYRETWPLLIVCPMSLMENWVKEINRFCHIPFSRMGMVNGKRSAVNEVHDVVVVSYSSLSCLGSDVYRMVIFDESHYIKGADTKRTKIALELARKADHVVLLSGTPALSRPIELFTQMLALVTASRHLPSHAQYAARYCNGYIDTFKSNCNGHSHTDELHMLLRSFMIRRTKKELGSALPSKRRQLLYLPVEEKGKKAMAAQLNTLRRSISSTSPGTGSGESFQARVPNAFEMRQATATAKVQGVTDYVADAVEKHRISKEKLIIFAHHQFMMEAVKKAVESVHPKHPVDYIFISGETPASQREQLAEHFRNDPCCLVAILSMQSSGVGHNFTCASTVIFAELDWTPSIHLQCEDRVHRMGQSRSCLIQYLLAEGTSDTVIWPLLNAKLSVTSSVLSSDGMDTDNRVQDGMDGEKKMLEVKDASQRTLDEYLPTPPTSHGSRSHSRHTTGGVSQEAKEASDPPSPQQLRASVTLEPLIAFTEMAKSDPVWESTAYSKLIPGTVKPASPYTGTSSSQPPAKPSSRPTSAADPANKLTTSPTKPVIVDGPGSIATMFRKEASRTMMTISSLDSPGTAVTPVTVEVPSSGSSAASLGEPSQMKRRTTFTFRTNSPPPVEPIESSLTELHRGVEVVSGPPPVVASPPTAIDANVQVSSDPSGHREDKVLKRLRGDEVPLLSVPSTSTGYLEEVVSSPPVLRLRVESTPLDAQPVLMNGGMGGGGGKKRTMMRLGGGGTPTVHTISPPLPSAPVEAPFIHTTAATCLHPAAPFIHSPRESQGTAPSSAPILSGDALIQLVSRGPDAPRPAAVSSRRTFVIHSNPAAGS